MQSYACWSAQPRLRLLYGRQSSSTNDLGIKFSDDVKVAAQCNDAYSLTNKMLGLLKQTTRFRNPKVLIIFYKSLVRPHVEYLGPPGDHTTRKTRILLEQVQRHNTCSFFPDTKDMCCHDRLQKLQLWSLEERRNCCDLIKVFKMVKGFSNVSWDTFFERSRTETM